MYREAVALSIHRNRPNLDVRAAPPEAAAGEIEAFGPHLLVHNDTAPIPEEVLGSVPYRLEVLYSDSMSARVIADGRAEEVVEDVGTESLLAAADGVAALTERETTPGQPRLRGQARPVPLVSGGPLTSSTVIQSRSSASRMASPRLPTPFFE